MKLKTKIELGLLLAIFITCFVAIIWLAIDSINNMPKTEEPKPTQECQKCAIMCPR